VKPQGHCNVDRADRSREEIGRFALSEERRNYGVEPEPQGSGSGGSGPGITTTTAMSPRDENTWSVLAHLSVFVNLLTGFLGPVVAMIIWFVYRDSSERVSFHALQSALYQLAWAVILAIGWTITGFLTVIIIGFLLIPVMIVLSVVPFVHMAYAAYKVNQGVDYRYPFVADLIGGSRRSGTL
jgi:uncharacterized Tic20 family protein